MGTVLGIGIAFLWQQYGSETPPGPSSTEAPGDAAQVVLSEATLQILGRLDSPMEIRFYTSLDSAQAPTSLRAFSTRVKEMLSAFSQAANGRLKVEQHDPALGPDARAQAIADGVQPWTLRQGDPAFLGLAIIQGENSGALPMLDVEWEPALEYDLARAIDHLNQQGSTQQQFVPTSNLDADAGEQIARLIPDLATISAEEGGRILQEAALAEFQTVVEDMQVQVSDAEQRVLEAQRNGSETEARAALERLRKLRADETRKLQEVARRLQEQLAALDQLKGIPETPSGGDRGNISSPR
jgi:hypothetical protein